MFQNFGKKVDLMIDDKVNTVIKNQWDHLMQVQVPLVPAVAVGAALVVGTFLVCRKTPVVVLNFIKQ